MINFKTKKNRIHFIGAQKVFASDMKNIAKSAAPNDIVYTSAHSRGNILPRNTGRSWKAENSSLNERIYLVSFGSPVVIPDRLFKHVEMHISRRDGVSMLCGHHRVCPPDHRQIHKSNGGYLIDHVRDYKSYNNNCLTKLIDYANKH